MYPDALQPVIDDPELAQQRGAFLHSVVQTGGKSPAVSAQPFYAGDRPGHLNQLHLDAAVQGVEVGDEGRRVPYLVERRRFAGHNIFSRAFNVGVAHATRWAANRLHESDHQRIRNIAPHARRIGQVATHRWQAMDRMPHWARNQVTEDSRVLLPRRHHNRIHRHLQMATQLGDGMRHGTLDPDHYAYLGGPYQRTRHIIERVQTATPTVDGVLNRIPLVGRIPLVRRAAHGLVDRLGSRPFVQRTVDRTNRLFRYVTGADARSRPRPFTDGSPIGRALQFARAHATPTPTHRFLGSHHRLFGFVPLGVSGIGPVEAPAEAITTMRDVMANKPGPVDTGAMTWGNRDNEPTLITHGVRIARAGGRALRTAGRFVFRRGRRNQNAAP